MWVGGISLQSSPQMRGYGQLSHPHPQGQFTLAKLSVNSTVMPKRKAGPASLSATAGKGEDQLPRLSHTARDKELEGTSLHARTTS